MHFITQIPRSFQHEKCSLENFYGRKKKLGTRRKCMLGYE